MIANAPPHSQPSSGSLREGKRLHLRFRDELLVLEENGEPIHVGRAPSNRISLPDEEISASRHHGQIYCRDGEFIFADQSRNGTHFLSARGERFHLYRAEKKLTGKGHIGLGQAANVEDPLVIHYEVIPDEHQEGDKGEETAAPLLMQKDDPEHELLRLLLQSSLSSGLSREECLDLLPLVELRSLIAHELLAQEGEIGSYLYAIVSGSIAVYLAAQNTIGRVPLDTLEPGSLAGEFGFVENIERTATLRATTPSRVLCLDRNRFEAFAETHPKIAYQLLRTIVRSVRTSIIRLNLEKMDLENSLRRLLRKGKTAGGAPAPAPAPAPGAAKE